MRIQSKYNFLLENTYIIHKNEPNVTNKSFTLLRTYKQYFIFVYMY